MDVDPNIYDFESRSNHGDIYAFGLGALSTALCLSSPSFGHFVIYFFDGARR